MFNQNIEVIHLGDGSDDALWATAAGKVGYVEGGGSKTGNTFIDKCVFYLLVLLQGTPQY